MAFREGTPWDSWLYRLEQIARQHHLPGNALYRRWVEHHLAGRLQQVPYFEGHIWICPVYTMGRDVYETGCYEPIIVHFIRTFVQAGFSFIDVGANSGSIECPSITAHLSSAQLLPFLQRPERSLLL